jgi:hypothetical protein
MSGLVLRRLGLDETDELASTSPSPGERRSYSLFRVVARADAVTDWAMVVAVTSRAEGAGNFSALW